jgi:hypothetical protein
MQQYALVNKHIWLGENMKKTAKHILLMAPLLCLFTTSCGDNFDDDPKGKGPFCVYAGVRYEVWEQWPAKDGCNTCICGGSKFEVLCRTDKICGDGGASDGSRAADATHDGLVPSDVMTPASDVPVDSTQDVASVDVPVSDGNRIDVAADGPVSDGLLDAERD